MDRKVYNMQFQFEYYDAHGQHAGVEVTMLKVECDASIAGLTPKPDSVRAVVKELKEKKTLPGVGEWAGDIAVSDGVNKILIKGDK